MSYNPFDDLPVAVKEEEKVEQAPKRRKIETFPTVDIAECKEEEDNTNAVSIKTEEPTSLPHQQVDVLSTLQTLKKHIFNSKYGVVTVTSFFLSLSLTAIPTLCKIYFL
jgi:hypothetical protein